MKYIEYSIGLIQTEVKKKDSPVVIRVETNSGDEKPRKLLVQFVGEDYIVGLGLNQVEPEIFGFANIASWRFAKYNPKEWGK